MPVGPVVIPSEWLAGPPSVPMKSYAFTEPTTVLSPVKLCVPTETQPSSVALALEQRRFTVPVDPVRVQFTPASAEQSTNTAVPSLVPAFL